MVKNGDKLVVIKKISDLLNEGDIVRVISVSESGTISFAFGENFSNKGILSADEYNKHFEKLESEEDEFYPSIPFEYIEEIMANSKFTVDTVYDKCTIMACKLPNGYVIVESSACVNPEKYDKELGINICLDKLADRIWELESYKLQDELYEESLEDEDFEDDDYDEDDEEEYGCADCSEINCPDNPNNPNHHDDEN